MPSRWNRFPNRFSIVVVAVALLLLAAELVNGRFWLNDLRVYYGAANAMLNGDALYGVTHGLSSGYFKYAPFMAMVYVPLALLPYSIAAGIQYALIVSAFIGSALVADRLVRTHILGGKSASYAPLFLMLLVVAVHLHRELHLGNINVLLLWLLLSGLDRLLSGGARSAGLLIGLAILAKPHFVVLLPLLLLRGHGRSITMAMATVVAGLLVPAFFLGLKASLQLHEDWLGEMAKHNAALIYTGGEAYNNVDTVYSFLHRAVLGRFTASASSTEALLILTVIASLAGAVVLWNLKRERGRGGAPGHMVFEYFLLLALVPSITLTDTNHFLFAMPLVLLILHQLFASTRLKWLPLFAIPALVTFGGNWGDALGSFSDKLVHFGVLGIANVALLFIGALLLLFAGSNLPSNEASSHQANPHA
jgi:Glycosyltransferase family 87